MRRERSVRRRALLKGILAAGAAPWFVPSQLLAGPTSPSGKITVGVIGVGEQGFYDMQNFLSQDDVRLTAICDVNQRNIARARERIRIVYGGPDVKVMTDFRELCTDPSIDAVLMALPVHWHSLPSLDAILHGKHIFHEKPIGMSFGEAKLMRDAVRKKGVVFQFGTQQRSTIKFRWACELALNGRLGGLSEIQVSVPGGKQGPALPQQPVPAYIDWERWVGPAPRTPFNEEKLSRDNHENMTSFSLGMISCWGIHHLDIAQWGNGTDDTGPASIEGTGQFPGQGAFDAILNWKVRIEFAKAAPITFVSDGTPDFKHGVRFIGPSGWVHVDRGAITAHDEALLRDPGNRYGQMPAKLPVSLDHTRNFLDAIRQGKRAICDIETAVRVDTLCQLSLIAVKLGRMLKWDPQAERCIGDDAANGMLQPRPFREPWKLPDRV